MPLIVDRNKVRPCDITSNGLTLPDVVIVSFHPWRGAPCTSKQLYFVLVKPLGLFNYRYFPVYILKLQGKARQVEIVGLVVV